MKKFTKICMTLFSLALVSFSANAQSWQWATKAGGPESDVANCIEVDDVGNSYITGTFTDSISFGAFTLISPGTSVFIAKFDVNGTITWAITAANDSLISVSGICLDRSGNIAIAGHYSGMAAFGTGGVTTLTSTGDYDIFVARYDASGNFNWAKSTGGPGIDFAGGISSDDDGNLYITGDLHHSSFPFSSSKIFVAKYDSTGTKRWLKTELNEGNNHFGNGIKADSAGNSYLSGEFFGTVLFDSSAMIQSGNIESNIFIAKFDSTGTILWGQKAGAASGYAGSKAIDIDRSGNSYITGYYHGTISLGPFTITGTSGTAYDVFNAKCDATGNFVWVDQSIGAGNAKAITADPSGNIYVSGIFQSSISFGSYSLNSSGGTDVFIAKVDSFGNWIWASKCGGLQDDNLTSMKAHAGGIFITGNFTGTMHFGTALSLTSSGILKPDIFVSKINITSGINQLENDLKNVICFPDPATRVIQLHGINGEIDYSIFDALGKKISNGTVNASNQIIVDTLEDGIYFLHLSTLHGNTKQAKLKFIKTGIH